MSILVSALPLFVGERTDGTEVEVINEQTPWRVHLVVASMLIRSGGELKLTERKNRPPLVDVDYSPQPNKQWVQPEFDDSCWGRYQEELFEQMGGYGCHVGDKAWPALLCLRTRFGVTEPDKANDLTVSMSYLGGTVIYVNGKEVARSHLPQGKIDLLTPAEDYPLEAYLMADGETELPRIREHSMEEHRDRYEKRVRRLTAIIPPDALVKEANVLAIELHRAPLAMEIRNTWSHVGIREVRLTSASGAGVIPYAEAVKGLRIWNAWPMETVAEKRREELPTPGPMFGFPRAVPMKGLTVGNPFEPLSPVRIVGTRNGTCSGQVVLSDLSGLEGVTAKISVLTHANGETIPAEAIRIRYATQQEGAQYNDALMDKPQNNTKTQPVWILMQIPKNQPPGWYAGEMLLTANGKELRVPVQVLVCGFRLPEPKEYRSLVGLTHSPDTLALHYGVEPWSDEHFKLMAKTLEMLGQVGNDVAHVPVILHGHMGHRTGMIRFVKRGSRVEPEFSALERYLDLWTKYCPAPQVLNLLIWEPRFAPNVNEVYEGRRIQKENPEAKELVVTMLEPQTGRMAEMSAPRVGDEGSEEFWKPVLQGVREIVRKRGWSDRIITLGTCFDWRPTPKQGELLRQWAPYARWTGFSHWGDWNLIFGGPGPTPDGKFFTIGGLEVGYMDFWPLDAVYDKKGRKRPSGLFDPQGYRGPGEWRVHTNIPWAMTAPGSEGPTPTVRFQMLREAIQETEAWILILQATSKMEPAQQEPYRKIWQDAHRGYGLADRLTQAPLSLDWMGQIARTYIAAGELTALGHRQFERTK